MELKRRRCPHCGSSEIDAYKDDGHIHLKCDDCGKIIKSFKQRQINPVLQEIKKAEDSMLRRAMPSIIILIVFTIIFAIIAKYIS